MAPGQSSPVKVAGVSVTGGSNHTVHSGNVEIRNDLASSITQLRKLIDDLVELSAQYGASPQVQVSVAQATAEAAKAMPDTGRVRALMNAVRAGVGKVGPVATAALDVINVIGGIEKIVH